MPFVHLAVAIVLEVLGTAALQASDGLTRIVPTVFVVVFYAGAFFFLAQSLRTIPVGVAYAIWSGLGVVLISMVGWVWFRQALDFAAILGIALIVAGVIVIQVFSRSVTH